MFWEALEVVEIHIRTQWVYKLTTLTQDPFAHLNSNNFLNPGAQSTKHIINALGIVARAKGMTQVAQQCGIRREQLYQSLGESGNPTQQALLPILQALGLQLDISLKRA